MKTDPVEGLLRLKPNKGSTDALKLKYLGCKYLKAAVLEDNSCLAETRKVKFAPEPEAALPLIAEFETQLEKDVDELEKRNREDASSNPKP